MNGLLLLLASLLGLLGAQDKADARLFVRTDGDLVRAALQIEIEDHWHLYHTELGPEDAVGIPTTLELPDGVSWSEVRFPEPLKLDQEYGMEGEPTWIWGHEGTIVLHVAGRLEPGTDAKGLAITVKGLTCEDEGSCVPFEQSPRNEGPGSDALFAAFPADLAPPAAAGSGGVSSSESSEASAPPTRTDWDFDDGGFQRAAGNAFARVEGRSVRLAIGVKIDKGYHLYHEDLGPEDAVGKPTRVDLPTDGVTWSEVRFPEPHRFEQPGMALDGGDTWILGHEGLVVLHALGVLDEGVSIGDLGEVEIDGLTCLDDGECVPYAESLEIALGGPNAAFADFPADLAVAGAGASDPGGSSTGSSGTSGTTTGSAAGTGEIDWEAVTYPEYSPRTEGPERSLAMWLLFAFIAGMILNVMPCVLPVVSIKILSFVNQAGESRARIFQLGLAFAGGILAVFLALAALAAFAGKGWGEQFQSQEFLVVMIAIVFAFSLSLFDVFEIGVPTQVGQMASVRREGIGHAFFMGIMSTVLATPCSGPFLGSTLTWALAQPTMTVFLVFTFVGLGMAFPYVILTANPTWLKFVPKPGAWMQTFKHLMGFLLLGTVIFLMVSLRQDMILFTVAFLVPVGLACWIWGKYATFDQKPLQRLGTVAVCLVVLAGGARASFVDLRAFFAPPGEGEGHLAWVDFDPVLLQRYHDEGRSVFLDFTANWCLTCKTNEKVVYESDEIVALLTARGIVAMKADETNNTPKTRAIKRLRESLGANSIPFMAVFPGDDWDEPFTAKDLVTTAQVREMLEACPEWSPELASR